MYDAWDFAQRNTVNLKPILLKIIKFVPQKKY